MVKIETYVVGNRLNFSWGSPIHGKVTCMEGKVHKYYCVHPQYPLILLSCI